MGGKLPELLPVVGGTLGTVAALKIPSIIGPLFRFLAPPRKISAR